MKTYTNTKKDKLHGPLASLRVENTLFILWNIFVTNPWSIWLILEAEILNDNRISECDCSRHPNKDYSQMLLAYTNMFNTFSLTCYSDVLGILYQFIPMWFYNMYIIYLCRYYIFEWFNLRYKYEQCFYFRIKSLMTI